MNTRGRFWLGVAVAFYLLSLGGLVGVVVERVRFDRERGDVVARYEEALRRRNAERMALEVGR